MPSDSTVLVSATDTPAVLEPPKRCATCGRQRRRGWHVHPEQVLRSEACPWAKLTEAKVRWLRQRRAEGALWRVLVGHLT